MLKKYQQQKEMNEREKALKESVLQSSAMALVKLLWFRFSGGCVGFVCGSFV